jgi:hypothetical protein
MAFKIHTVLDGHIPSWQYLPAAAGTYSAGQATVFSGGKLVPVSSGVGEDTDEGRHYICMADTVIAEGGELPVVGAEEMILWEAPLAADAASLAAGQAYTISADGMKMTATATKGCCTVLRVSGKQAGDPVILRLV